MSKKYYMPDLDYDWFGEKPTGNLYTKRNGIIEVRALPGREINFNEVRAIFDRELLNSDNFMSDLLLGFTDEEDEYGMF